MCRTGATAPNSSEGIKGFRRMQHLEKVLFSTTVPSKSLSTWRRRSNTNSFHMVDIPCPGSSLYFFLKKKQTKQKNARTVGFWERVN